MRIRYFPDTDTLHIELRDVPITETRDVDADTVVELDADGRICAITVEHAATRTDVGSVSFERIAAH